MTTYEEWRVTAGLTTVEVSEIFRSEDKARAYVARLSTRGPLGIGPHLHRRTITVTEWADPPPPPLNRPHPTCIDVTGTDQPPRSEWTCGPDCPEEA